MVPAPRAPRNRIFFENPPGSESGFYVEVRGKKGRGETYFFPGRGLLSVTETAWITELSRVTIYRWIREGSLLAVKQSDGDSEVLRIPNSEVKRILKEDSRR